MAYVLIDAGHGGYDIGAEYKGRLEKDDNLDIALAVGELLMHSGVDITFTRVSDTYDSPARKVQMANENEADFFVSIHRDISILPNTESGIRASVYEDGRINNEMTSILMNEFIKAGQDYYGEAISPDIIRIINPNIPVAIIMLGYINSDKDNKYLDYHFNDLVYAVANAIYRCFYNEDIIHNVFEGMLFPADD